MSFRNHTSYILINVVWFLIRFDFSDHIATHIKSSYNCLRKMLFSDLLFFAQLSISVNGLKTN